jgi:hypothetical protein
LSWVNHHPRSKTISGHAGRPFPPSKDRFLLPSIPDLSNADVQPLRPHKPLPPLISLTLFLTHPLRRVTFNRRPLRQPLRTRIRYRARHSMPRPSDFSIHVHAIATPDSNGHSSLFRVFAFLQFGLASCDYENTVAAKGEGCQASFAEACSLFVRRASTHLIRGGCVGRDR